METKTKYPTVTKKHRFVTATSEQAYCVTTQQVVAFLVIGLVRSLEIYFSQLSVFICDKNINTLLSHVAITGYSE